MPTRTKHWPHRELNTRLLRTLSAWGWRTMAGIRRRDNLFSGMHLDLLLFHEEQSERVWRRRRRDGTNEFRLTPAGAKRAKG